MTTEDVSVPAPTSTPTAADADADTSPSSVLLPPHPLPDSFDSLGLDARLLRGLSKMGITRPTAVQAVTIPAALEGRDIVARARTGSGKTLAFLLPAFHAVARLSSSSSSSSSAAAVVGGGGGNSAREAARPWRALVLVPTRELAEQVADVADELARASGVHVRTSTLAATAAASSSASGATSASMASSSSSSSPRECQPSRCGQLVVSTPGRLAQALASLGGGGGTAGKASSSSAATASASAAAACSLLSNLAVVAVDEADLLLSLPGYRADLATASSLLPRGAQRMLLSATSAAAVDELGALMLQDPVHVDATRGGGGGGGREGGNDGDDSQTAVDDESNRKLQPPLAGVASSVSHYFLESPDNSDAGMLSTLIALLKLGAAKRRVLVFASSDDEGIKLKLALAAFGVKAARLGAALPLNSRHHALQEFNRGVYDYLIATDDGRGDASCSSKEEEEEEGDEEEGEGEGEGEDDEGEEKTASKKSKRAKQEKKQKAEQKKKENLGANAAEQQQQQQQQQEFGVVRGIDFSGVRTVVNYGPPRSATSYVHRAGRTGRAGAKGAVVTIFAKGKRNERGESERAALESSLVASSSKNDNSSSSSSSEPFRLLPYPRLPPAAPSALRYRVDDVARALTRPALREARAQELRRELLNSQRLAAHFAASASASGSASRDLALLRHDAPLSAAGKAAAAGGGGLLGSGGGSGGGGSSHLKRLPGYLMNAAGLRGKKAAAVAAAAAAGSAAKKKTSSSSSKKRTRDDGDPLRTLASAAAPPPATPALKAAFFARSSSGGGGRDDFDEMTPAEKKAQVEGAKAAKKAAKKNAPLAKVAAAAQVRQNAIAKGKHRRR